MGRRIPRGELEIDIGKHQVGVDPFVVEEAGDVVWVLAGADEAAAMSGHRPEGLIGMIVGEDPTALGSVGRVAVALNAHLQLAGGLILVARRWSRIGRRGLGKKFAVACNQEVNMVWSTRHRSICRGGGVIAPYER